MVMISVQSGLLLHWGEKWMVEAKMKGWAAGRVLLKYSIYLQSLITGSWFCEAFSSPLSFSGKYAPPVLSPKVCKPGYLPELRLTKLSHSNVSKGQYGERKMQWHWTEGWITRKVHEKKANFFSKRWKTGTEGDTRGCVSCHERWSSRGEPVCGHSRHFPACALHQPVLNGGRFTRWKDQSRIWNSLERVINFQQRHLSGIKSQLFSANVELT